MFAPRLIGTTAATLLGAFGLLGAPGMVSAGTPPETSAPPTTAPPSTEPSTSPPPTSDNTSTDAAVTAAAACEVVAADVEGGTATFTVGPEGCTGEVGPISFSTYELPSGQILPYEDQVLIAHADGNGSVYSAGTYTLNASLGAALNWQADLYYGTSDDQPPHPETIDVDAQTGVVSDAKAPACDIVDSDVESGTATFTVGPEGCTGEVGPISFSTYELPSGQILPYEDQVLIAHADGNGSMYAAGSYTLNASLGEAQCWQSDLYFGASDDQPPHPDMIDVDGKVCEDAASATTTPVPVTVVVTPNVVVNVSVPESASAGPTLPVAPENEVANASAVAVVNESAASQTAVAAQTATTSTTTTTTTPAQTLPETGGGSSTPIMVAAGGALSLAGLLTRRLARRH
jgi:LPXTG-motif cell wall-anchored protein